MSISHLNWYAVRVRSRCEKLTASDLANRGYEVCSACAPQRRIWADRIRVVEMPMFPGYIFARFDPTDRSQVLNAAGIVSIVGFGTTFMPVEESEIEGIRIVLRSGVEVLREAAIQPGSKVRVRYGALRGLEGQLIEVKSQHRLIVSVGLLQRAVAVEVDSVMVEPIGLRPASRTGAAA